MPQPWTMCRPCRSPNASIIARGGAAPPTVMNRIEERSHLPGFASSACRIPIQIVGTPAETVILCSTNPSSRVSGSMCGPGKACLTPFSVEENGKHHAFAWNIGTTGRHTSSAWMPRRRVHRERVERDRAMRVEDALGPAGGAARVTHRRGRVLGQVAVRELRLVRVGEELLVVDRPVRRRAVADRDDVLEAAAARRTARRAATASCRRAARGRRRASRCRRCRRDGGGGSACGSRTRRPARPCTPRGAASGST